jgi:vesicle coat complex subunit
MRLEFERLMGCGMYRYLINYAKSQPELVILAVNTFVKVGIDFTMEVVHGF